MKFGNILEIPAQLVARSVDEVLGTDLSNCRGCKMMVNDFNLAKCPSDYTKAVVDRLLKRGKYSKQNEKETKT